MKRITLALLALLAVSCTLWQPYGASSFELQRATPTPTPTGIPSSTTPTYTATKYVFRTCTVIAEALNVRSGAGTSYPVIGYLYEGDTVTFRFTSGAWLKTSAGWIHGAYCHDLP